MQPGAATHHLRLPPLLQALLLALAAAGCSSGPARFEPGALSAAQVQQCRAIELAYRQQAADYPQRRDAALADPVATAWVVRMFVRDLFAAREGQVLGEDTPLLRAAARVQDPVETRALAELRGLGAAAVPTLVGDLLLHEQPQPRELGIELLVMIGAPAVPALQEVARTGAPRPRRSAARALGGIGLDERAVATLRELVRDPDFTVRADAVRSLRSGGEPVRLLLIERLRADEDAFVRRVAAQSLGAFPGADSMLALVEYLEYCKGVPDAKGEQIAQQSLQQLAGSRGPRTPDAWRAAAAQLRSAPPSGAR
jgi:HEAT repeats